MKERLEKVLPAVVTLLALGAVLLQIPVIYSVIDKASDQQKSTDIQTLQNLISRYESSKSKLPEQLSQLDFSDTYSGNMTALQSRLSDYTLETNNSGASYKLCANFKTDTSNSKSQSTKTSEYDNSYNFGLRAPETPNTDTHPKGYHCFSFTPYPSYYDPEPPIPVSPTDSLGSLQQKARDTEIQTDVKSLAVQLEAYYNSNEGNYPTAKDLNDKNWRDKNLVGYDNESAISPDGKTLGSSGGYTYTPVPASCNNESTKCTSFKLVAVLSTGLTYTKNSLN